MLTSKPVMLIYGNCQVGPLWWLLHQIPEISEHYDLRKFHFAGPDVPLETTEVAPEIKAQCRFFLNQVGPWGARDNPALAGLPADCEIIHFPVTTAYFLWPLMNPWPDPLPGQPPRPDLFWEFGDRLIFDLIEKGVPRSEIADAYYSVDITEECDPLRQREMESWRNQEFERHCDVKIIDFVEAHLSKERLFWTGGHLSNTLLLELVRRLTTALAGRGAFSHFNSTGNAPPFLRALPEHEIQGEAQIPVHPEVARLFGLTWYDANFVYKNRGWNNCTHRQYVEWIYDYVKGDATSGSGLASDITDNETSAGSSIAKSRFEGITRSEFVPNWQKFMEAGQYAAARDLALWFLEKNPENPVRIYLATTLIAMHHHKRALDELATISKTAGDNVWTWTVMADCYRRLGQVDEATSAQLIADRLSEAANAAANVTDTPGAGSPLFRAPVDLSVTPTPLRRILLIGACLIVPWGESIAQGPDGVPHDHLHFNQLPDATDLPCPIEAYDLQLVGIPFRAVLPEASYFRLSFSDPGAFEALFVESCDRLQMLLDYAMQYNRAFKILSFVTNFFVPIQNPMGRLMPRYDLRNPVYFAERLNQRLVELLGKYENSYLLDIDEIAATFGRRYIQDDFVWVGSHGSLIEDWDHPLDQARIAPPRPMSELYENRTREFLAAARAELFGAYRTLRQIDSVKMVIMDLDDTMWRGVLAEADTFNDLETGGWPLGVAEALIYLKRRGIILAIVSKNDEANIERIWSQILAGRLELSDFAFRRINWRPKAENIREIIEIANILPSSVVFVDDNPVERASVEGAISGIRVIGAEPYLLKRILLWSSETQVAAVTEESGRRTEMLQKQAEREVERRSMSRDEFLASLHVQVRMLSIDSTEHPSFDRVFELLNKTNQFNTTGRRWQRHELWNWIESGNRISAFIVEDRFTKYGLVGIVLHDSRQIEQFVMSCRVLGMDVEIAILASVMRDFASRGVTEITARLVETPANMPCRDLYARAAFIQDGDVWLRKTGFTSGMAPHVTVFELAAA